MSKRAFLSIGSVAVALLTLSDGSVGKSLTWNRYHDRAHGCGLSYPQELFLPDPPQPHQPQRFSGADGDTYFRVIGVENGARWTPKEIKDKFLSTSMPGDVTYDRTKMAFLVLSGYRGSNIFYTKVAVSEDRHIACILDITYPRSQKKQFDSIVTRMSHSFDVRP